MHSVRLIVALGACVALQSTAIFASTPFFQEPPSFNFQLYGGFREDYLKVHIGGDRHADALPIGANGFQLGGSLLNSLNPPTQTNLPDLIEEHRHNQKNFSRVRWQNLKIAQIGASINTSGCHNYYMRASGDYGRIFNGSGRITNRYTYLHALPPPPPPHHHHHHHDHHHDHHHHHESYESENITPSFPLLAAHHHHDHHHHDHHKPEKPHIHYIQLHEVSKLGAQSNWGNVCDLSGGLGWKVITDGGRGWIAGIIGYSYEHQNLEMSHFRRLEDTHNLIQPEQLGGLKFHYQTKRIGPWGGIDFSAQVECNASWFGSIEWHVCDFRGNGKWHQPKGFKASTHQHSRGYGVVGNLGFDWAPWDQWSIGMLFNYQQWSTRRGGNHAKIRNVQPGSGHLLASLPIAKKSPFYRSTWVTYSVSVESAYRF